MHLFRYVRAEDEARALKAGSEPGAAFLAGGTTLVDLVKLDVEKHASLVDIQRLPLARIEAHAGGVRIGAMARNSDVADHPLIKLRYPVLSEALLSGASPQLRNMATVGGNLLQRTRCPYFRDVASACNKRSPQSGCAAWDGYNRSHAVLGGSERCIAAHPSDMCVALIALDAQIHTQGPRGARAIPMALFHLIPGDHPEVETVLDHGELITHVDVPASRFAERSLYLKVRDRASYEFALTAAAVAIDLEGAKIRDVRVAFGGVGTKPWRSVEAETILTGSTPSLALYQEAAKAGMADAVPRKHNQFKIELMRRTLVRALSTLVPVEGGVT